MELEEIELAVPGGEEFEEDDDASRVAGQLGCEGCVEWVGREKEKRERGSVDSEKGELKLLSEVTVELLKHGHEERAKSVGSVSSTSTVVA